jgi:hypothetical protein
VRGPPGEASRSGDSVIRKDRDRFRSPTWGSMPVSVFLTRLASVAESLIAQKFWRRESGNFHEKSVGARCHMAK